LSSINSFKLQNYPRIEALVTLSEKAITTPIYLTAGVMAGVASIATLGTCTKLNNFAFEKLSPKKGLWFASGPILVALKILNPRACFDESQASKKLAHYFLPEKIDKWISHCVNSQNLFIKEVGSRALCVVKLGSACLICPAYLAIGVVGSIFALLTAGHFGKLNRLAKESLERGALIIPIIIKDIIRMLNPHATAHKQEASISD
jgi:hypothetical protein